MEMVRGLPYLVRRRDPAHAAERSGGRKHVPLRGYNVTDFMYEDIQTLRPDDPLQLVLDLMPNAKYGAFVVVDDARRPLGIVTETDVLKRVLVGEPPGGAYLRTITASYEAA